MFDRPITFETKTIHVGIQAGVGWGRGSRGAAAPSAMEIMDFLAKMLMIWAATFKRKHYKIVPLSVISKSCN